jgi:hypothetical protein
MPENAPEDAPENAARQARCTTQEGTRILHGGTPQDRHSQAAEMAALRRAGEFFCSS